MTRLALASAWLVLASLTQQGSSPVPLMDDDVVFVDSNPATTTGLYHRQGCIWAARAWPTKITLKEAKSRYFQAHCECTMGVKVPPPCPDVTPQQPTAQPPVGSMAVEAPKPSTPAKHRFDSCAAAGSCAGAGPPTVRGNDQEGDPLRTAGQRGRYVLLAARPVTLRYSPG